MLLRSSSSPILGSLLSSSPFFSESPNNNKSSHRHSLERTSSPSSSSSFSHGIAHHSNPSFHCCFSPISDPSDRDASSLGFRRALSDGNLKSLLPDDSHHHNHSPIKSSSSGRRANRVLKIIPSFSMYSSKEEEEQEPQGDQEEGGGGGGLKRSVAIGETIAGEFDSSGENQEVGLGDNSRDGNALLPPLFLARGLGIDRLGSGTLDAGSGGTGGSSKCTVLTGNGGEQSNVETYYKKMVDENPGNALFLRNYAQFLYQAKGDPQRAEEYYSRAVLADPGDGEILSQYAKLVWELHHDEERASSYFEKAVQATPHDSHVLASYAAFLWETEDDSGVEGGEGGHSQDYAGASIHLGALASTTASS